MGDDSDAFGYNSAMTSCRADSWATGVMMLGSMKLLKIEMQVVSWLHGPGENVPKWAMRMASPTESWRLEVEQG